MVNPAEYLVAIMKREYSKLPNSTEEEAMKSLYQVVQSMDTLSGHKAYCVAAG